MSTVELRRRVKLTVDTLYAEKLMVADVLLRQLREEQVVAATAELLRIPGCLESYQRGLRDIAAGRVTPLEKLRRKK